MGFLDKLGGSIGKLGAKAMELYDYKCEYECMCDTDLIREYKSLVNHHGTEERKRFLAVKMVLVDRGYFQNED